MGKKWSYVQILMLNGPIVSSIEDKKVLKHKKQTDFQTFVPIWLPKYHSTRWGTYSQINLYKLFLIFQQKPFSWLAHCVSVKTKLIGWISP